MIAIHRTVPSLLLAAALTVGGVATPSLASSATAEAATAQPSGDNLMIQAAEAVRKLESLSAKFVLDGESGFGNITPESKGTIRMARQDEPVDGFVWHIRIDGTYAPNGTADDVEMSAMRTPDSFVFVDHEKKAVYERARTDNRNAFFTAMEMIGLPELTGEEPYNRELREAESWNYEGTETVNGVECNVVTVTYRPPTNDDGQTGAGIDQSSKWFLGTEDHLPRRVDRITSGMISYTISLTMSDVKTDASLEPEDLAIETPDGFNRIVANSRSGRPAGAVRNRPAQATRPADDGAEPSEAEIRNALPAHGFELVDGDGNEVSLESLKGSVAVLYFWGTWCVPCREYSPLVSDLVTTFEGEPVRVFGLPVRERSESNVREASGKYDYTLLLDPSERAIGCDATARAYKVRRYPTVYVIGPNSEQLAVEWPKDGVSAQDTMAKIEKTIRDTLAGMN